MRRYKYLGNYEQYDPTVQRWRSVSGMSGVGLVSEPAQATTDPFVPVRLRRDGSIEIPVRESNAKWLLALPVGISLANAFVKWLDKDR